MNNDQFDELKTLISGNATQIKSLGDQIESLNGRITAMDARIEGMDGRITAMDARIEGMDGRISKQDAQFAKLFQRMESGFTEIKAELATKASADQLHSVLNLLDANIKEHEKQEQERLAMSKQLDRHDEWLHQLAQKTGVTLSYE